MTDNKFLALAVAAALVALLALPAVASAAEDSADFEARVNAQNKDMYSFTIDYDHVEYIPASNAGKPLPSRALDPYWQGWSTADHDITVTNTGAMPFDLMVQASSEPTATDGVEEYSVALASSAADYLDTEWNPTPSGGVGKAIWSFSAYLGPYFSSIEGVNVNAPRSFNLVVGKDDTVRLASNFIAPNHWPHDTALDYNWGGTIIAAPIE